MQSEHVGEASPNRSLLVIFHPGTDAMVKIKVSYLCSAITIMLLYIYRSQRTILYNSTKNCRVLKQKFHTSGLRTNDQKYYW